MARPSPGPSGPRRSCPAPRLTVRALGLQDTPEEDAVPSHTATATLVLEVQPADLRPPWFLPCVYEEPHFCLSAQYRGAVPTGHRLVLGPGLGRAKSRAGVRAGGAQVGAGGGWDF